MQKFPIPRSGGADFLPNPREGIGHALAAVMAAHRFQDLIAWRLARDLRKQLWQLTLITAAAREPNFCYQLRKAARSSTANIAEGFPCTHIEFARFLDISA